MLHHLVDVLIQAADDARTYAYPDGPDAHLATWTALHLRRLAGLLADHAAGRQGDAA